MPLLDIMRQLKHYKILNNRQKLTTVCRSFCVVYIFTENKCVYVSFCINIINKLLF